MNRRQILDPNQSYTFTDYFKLNFDIEDILAYFDVSFERRFIELPRYTGDLDRLADLKARIIESLPNLNLNSEMARREFLIAPVIIDLLHYAQAKVNVEYPVNVSNQLKGSLDYLLRSDQSMLVIEAKNEDLDRGFVQLSVELIALDQWLDTDQPILYGAVSTGKNWQFGQFHRADRLIIEGLNLYRVPDDLEELLRILIARITDRY